jgi:beta-lactamase regulating signal transducer with metallopeptidase domain
MRRWLTIMIFVLALAAPAALAQDSSSSSSSTQSQPAQGSQSGSSSKQTTTTTTTTKSTAPAERTGIDPLYLAIGGIALITIIAIALLAARSRGRDRVATVRETTVIKD